MIRNNALKNVMKVWLEAVINQYNKEYVAKEIQAGFEDILQLARDQPERRQVRDELIKDKEISKHFNSQIESDCLPEPLILSPDEVLDQIPQHIIISPVLDEQLFERFYEIFEKSFYSDFIEFEVVAPVQGLLMYELKSQDENSRTYDDDLEPFKLSSDLIIRPLKEGERKFAHEFEILRRYGQFSDNIYAFCATYRFKKKLSPISKSSNFDPYNQQQVMDQKRSELDILFNEVEYALRLFKAGSIVRTGSIHINRNFFAFNGGNIFSANQLPSIFSSVPPLSIIREERPDFLKLWQKLQKVKKSSDRKSLLVALRRYNYSRTRTSLEDKIIDLMIAAEALSSPENVSDRVSFVAKYYGKHFPSEKTHVTELIRKVYGMRNDLMHKGDLEKWSKIHSNRNINIWGYVANAEELTRQILLKEIMSIS